MEIKLINIIYCAIISGALVALIWELIPEERKKFWEYANNIRKDRRREQK